MSSRKCTTIPRSFSWVLPTQSIVTGVAIYSTVFVFKVGSKTFILAVVAAGLQFFLGLYSCFTVNRPGTHHAIVVPILLAGIAGVWCGPVYYFARITDLYLKLQKAYPSSATPSAATWSYIGLAASCVDVVIALGLLTIFLVEGPTPARPNMDQNTFNGYTSAPVYTTPNPDPNTYHYQQPQQQQQYHYHQQPPQPVMTSAQTYPSYTTSPTHDNKYTPPTTTTTPISPITTPLSAPTTSPFQPPTSSIHDRNNRISSIQRICALQSPQGNWTYSPELADLVRHWSSGGKEIRPGAGYNDDRALTLAVHDCLRGLCEYVWATQGDRAAEEGLSRLSPGEMARFQGLNWDLGFARGAMERAVRWAGPG